MPSSKAAKKEAINTLSMALQNNVNYHKVVKICMDSLYCVSNAVEI
jgi:hypothetical protein